MKKTKVVLSIAVFASLAACSSPPRDEDRYSYGPSRPSEFGCLAGTVSGAIIGGIVGSAFGGGRGRTLATGVGAGTGTYLGNRLGCQ